MQETVLRGAYLYGTDLSGANLSGADLSDTALFNVTLSGAILERADLDEASLGGTLFAKTDMRTTKGLATIQHPEPSHIELFSVQLPQDKSALRFLREIGVPDPWIEICRSHMMPNLFEYEEP